MRIFDEPVRESWAADDVLREVWRIKDELSASYGHDLRRMFASLRERERHSGHRVVDLSNSYREEPAAPACVRETPDDERK